MTVPGDTHVECNSPDVLEITNWLLTTTRAVRRRLDLDRAVPDAILAECLTIACQAPTGGGRQNWRWVIVRDSSQRRAIAELYREVSLERFHDTVRTTEDPTTRRVYESATRLAEVLDQVPVLVLACIEGRSDGTQARDAALFGSVVPAVWSFQLALRARGLGSTYVTAHLAAADRIATLLDIPPGVTQVAMLPVAYTRGTEFKTAARQPISQVCFGDRWGRPWEPRSS